MKLLIVEDHDEIARLLARALATVDRTSGQDMVTSVDTVADLETAIERLPQADAVLCDGMFPSIPESCQAFENWAVVAMRCRKLGIPCVIYSGSAEVIRLAVLAGLPALVKPAPVEGIYAALTRPSGDRAVLRSGDFKNLRAA